MSFAWSGNLFQKLLIIQQRPSLNTVKKSPNRNKLHRFMEKTPCLSHIFLEGSMTIESVMVVPLFIFFIYGLCTIFATVGSYVDKKIEILDTGMTLALYSGDFDLGAIDGSDVFFEDDCLDIRVSKLADSRWAVTGLVPYIYEYRFYAHIWNGYNVLSNADQIEKTVFITETGKVYHCDENCSYIKPDIINVLYGEAQDLKNEGGTGYRLCEVCGIEINLEQTQVFITRGGYAIHSRLDCPTIKRTVRTVLLSEVNNYLPCHRCSRKG